MAQDGVKLDKKTFSCSICADLLKDPVTIPCGHSFCMSCVKTHWDKEDGKRVHTCPECKQTFKPRPVLEINTMLASVLEELRKTGLQTAADLCYAGPKDVACDVCTREKLKACKSCLVCLASFCEEHLQPHYESPAFEKHKLVEPSKNHKENLQKRIKEREKDVKLLQQEVEAINQSANKTVRDSEMIFTELLRTLEERRANVKQLVRSQQKIEVGRVKELQEKLQQEIAELKRKDAEMDDQFLPLSESVELPKSRPLQYFDAVTESLLKARFHVSYALGQQWPDFPQAVAEVDVLLPQPEPKTRVEFLKYSKDLTLDQFYPHVRVSDHSKKATVIKLEQSFFSNPIHPEWTVDNLARTGWAQLLGKQLIMGKKPLSGHCYWEVRWRGRGVHVGVSYRFKRNRPLSLAVFCPSEFGMEDRSLTLLCDKQKYYYWDNNRKVPISVRPSSRVGMYLDEREGILSFYKISDSSDDMTFLHRVKTTFTDQVNAAIWISNEPGTTAEFTIFRHSPGLHELCEWVY